MKSDHMVKDIEAKITEQGVATAKIASQNEEIIAALKSSATADQTAKVASLKAELKIARLELRTEKAEKQNAELRAEKEIASLKQQLSSATDSKKRPLN